MPDEPNKKMDEMLRSYAQERRKASDVPLHPATRNLLQGEVNRVFGRSGPATPWWRKLHAFWPHLTFAGGLCLVFGIAVLSLRQPSQTSEESRTETAGVSQTAGKDMSGPDLAKQVKKMAEPAKPQEGANRSGAAAPLLAPPPADATPSRNVELSIAPEQKLKERVVTQSAAERPAQRVSAGRERQEKREAEQEALLLRSEARLADAAAKADAPETDRSVRPTAQPALPAIAPNTTKTSVGSKPIASGNARTSSPQLRSRGLAATESQTRAAQLTNLSAARRLNFVQQSNAPAVAGAPLNVAPPVPVLVSFQVEQFGTNMRVMDRDGSIYLGVLKPTNVVSTPALKDEKAQIDNSLAYYFRVQGTNRTLNSDVVLTGNYFEQTNFAQTPLDAFATAPGQPARQQGQARYLIIGNATVGSNEVPVRAVSTSP